MFKEGGGWALGSEVLLSVPGAKATCHCRKGAGSGVVETAREKDEDKRSWLVFRGDLVREIARMALRKDRGPRVDSPDRCSWPCGGYPVERGHGWSSWGCEKGSWV